MDDVWNTKVLDDVRNIFSDDVYDDYGSRILLTTRLANVASYLDKFATLDIWTSSIPHFLHDFI